MSASFTSSASAGFMKKNGPYDSHSKTRSHKVEPSLVGTDRKRNPGWVSTDERPERHPGRRPGRSAALRGRALGRSDDVHRAERHHRAGQIHHVPAAASPGAQRAGQARRPRPVPARRDVRELRLAGRRRSRPGRGGPAVPGAAWPGDRRDDQPRRGQPRAGRADRPGRQHLPDRRHQLGRHVRAAALLGAGQGAAGLRNGSAAAGSARAAHRQDDHHRAGAARRPGARARPRLRGHRRGTRTRPGRGGRAHLRLRRHGGRGALGVGSGQQDDQGRTGRRHRPLRRGGHGPVRSPRLPAAVRSAEPKGRVIMSEPKGPGPAWTEERGTSDEGRRDPEGPWRREESTELLSQLYDYTLAGNKPAVLELTNAGLAMGLGPETLLYEALIPSLEEVGARFERGDFFVPEMLIAGKAMAGALEILRPLLAETGAQAIGKNLVNIMFEGAGFQVIDLGVQVAPEKFIEAIKEHKPDIVGFSAFLTTTMPMFKANINALQKSGLRDQ